MNNTKPYFYSITASDLLIRDIPVFSRPEESEKGQNKHQILEQYYNDLYKLFLAKLSKFDCDSVSGNQDRKKLTSLLDELIYVKTLLEEVT